MVNAQFNNISYKERIYGNITTFSKAITDSLWYSIHFLISIFQRFYFTTVVNHSNDFPTKVYSLSTDHSTPLIQATKAWGRAIRKTRKKQNISDHLFIHLVHFLEG